MKSNDLFNQVISPVNTKYGAPMGRSNVYPDNAPTWFENFSCLTPKEHIQLHCSGKVYDRIVQLDSGGYDKGGAYWGHGAQLRVAFSQDLTFILFYREPNR